VLRLRAREREGERESEREREREREHKELRNACETKPLMIIFNLSNQY